MVPLKQGIPGASSGIPRFQWPLLGAASFLGGFLLSSNPLNAEVRAEPAKLPWNHNRMWQTYDHASIRRGYIVYKNVCANCHSLSSIAYRHLIGVCFTEEEAKAFAEEITVIDGPDDEGNTFERPGKITDKFPKPYENDKAARFANNGALPSDLSNIIKAREGGADYVFSLMTGYRQPPAGINIREGLHYNIHFPGTSIAMAQALSNGIVEYDDGTEPTISQMAKDVTTFLCWASEPEHDERKLFGLKVLSVLLIVVVPTVFMKRFFFWSTSKSNVYKFY